MILLPSVAAIAASFGWATGIVLAEKPAQKIGAFEFTRIQLIASGAILGVLCTILGYWESVSWKYWPAFFASIVLGIILGNLAMIECLRRGGPRITELLLSLKAPLIAGIAYVGFGETLTSLDLIGTCFALLGICLAIFYGNNMGSESGDLSGSIGVVIALGFIAALFQGIGFLIVKPAMLSGTEPLVISAIRLLGAAFVISVIALWPTKAFRSQSQMTPKLLGRTILPGFIGYGISSSLLLYGFANYNAGIVAVLGSLSPVFVLPIIWIKDGKAPRIQAVIGALFVILGTSIIILL